MLSSHNSDEKRIFEPVDGARLIENKMPYVTMVY